MSIGKLSRINGKGFLLLLGLVALLMACPEARAGGKVTTCTETALLGALGDGGTVTFSSSCTEIELSNTITIYANTTIDGGVSGVVISGPGLYRSFIVIPGVTLNLKHLTLCCAYSGYNSTTGAVDGGAVLNNGTLNVTNCTFSSNLTNGSGGAIANYGQLTVANSTFENNTAFGYFGTSGLGGGIYNSNDATITNSTFTGNVAFSGGGIFTGSPTFGGLLVVESSTFSNNTFTTNLGTGGGIFNQSFITTVTNSTFYANGGTNEADGGNFYNANCCVKVGMGVLPGVAVLRNDTFDGGIAAAGNGGNISNVQQVGQLEIGQLIVENTIIANAASGSSNCNGSYTSLGGNLLWPESDLTCIGLAAGFYGDPELGKLQNNGGPTQTMAIRPGSNALYAATESNCPPTDQRGVIRPQGPICDIGAFEYSTAKSMGRAVVHHLHLFLDSLLSPASAHNLSESVITPLGQSLDPDLWPNEDGNHVDSSEVFMLQQAAVQSLDQLLIDQRQLDYINNLVMADRTLAATTINDKGCNANPNPAVGPNAPATPCSLAEAALAAGDASAQMGNYVQAIGYYQNAWQLTSQ